MRCRFQNWSSASPGAPAWLLSLIHIFFADLSKNLIDEPTLALLLQMAEQCQLPQQRDALLRGDIANVTEGRAVLHTACLLYTSRCV